MARDLDILILAAGRGTRMKSDLPKVLHPLLGEPLIHHVLDAAFALKPREVGVIVGHGAAEVKEALAGYDVTFVHQKEQKGTGHAIKCAARRFSGRKGHVMILSGDVPLIQASTLDAFFREHKRARVQSTFVTAVLDDPGSLGRVVRDEGGAVTAIVEARDATPEQREIREINAGIYLFRNASLFDGLKGLRRHGGSGEYYLTDVPKKLAAVRKGLHAWTLEDPSEALGINTQQDRLAAQAALRERIAHEHIARGVELVDPSLTFIGKNVTIGPGTVVWPFSAVMAGVTIGARCRIGPYAHLRTGTVVEDGAAVGNFVEIKNSTLGAGSLALHLAYLGDAEVGRGVNVGAGTITANYDGTAKHRTKVGDGAFLGSGAILVAPLEVGEGAVVGARAVIPSGRDVEPDTTVAGVPAKVMKEAPRGKKRRGRKGRSDG